jgi:chromosome segregation ATPase
VASISTAELRKNGNVFTGGVDAAEKAACVKRVAAARQQVEVFAKEIGECTARKKKLEQDIEQAQRRIQSLGQMQKLARDTHNKLTGNVATARAQLESASRTLDVAAIETRVNAELKAMTKQRVVCCLDLVELTTQLADTTHEHATRTLRCKELGIQKAYFDAQWDAANAANDKMRKELPAAENKLRENKELARELRVPAMAATDQRDPGKDPTLQQQFDQWDDDLVVLEEAIAMFENEADAIMCPNEGTAVLGFPKSGTRFTDPV